MTSRFLICFIAVSIASVSAISKELHDKVYTDIVLPHVLKCSNEFTVKGDQLKEAKDKGEAGDISPCFFSCVFKGIGFLDEQNKFNPEVAIEQSKKILTEEEDLKAFEKIINTCTKVNDVDISDKCERATLLFKCAVDNKALIFSQ